MTASLRAFFENIPQHYGKLVRWCERGLGLALFVGIAVAAVYSGLALVNMDWRSTTAFDELIDRVLLLVIGLELVRLLITHELTAVLELLAFVIARKMLKPDLQSHEIALNWKPGSKPSSPGIVHRSLSGGSAISETPAMKVAPRSVSTPTDAPLEPWMWTLVFKTILLV